MNKLKETLARRVQDLGESLSNDDDLMMEDMNEFVTSPYEGPPMKISPRAPVEMMGKTIVSRTKSAEQRSDDEFIDSIDAAYFIEHDFDAIDYELRKLYDIDMCYEDISRERLRLKAQLNVVSKRISALIMQKAPSYSSNISEIESIREGLLTLLANVTRIRRSLGVAKDQSTTALRILANERKKHMLRRLHDTLTTIKTFYESEFWIQEVIQRGEFPSAIQMFVQAQDAAKNFRHFNCVNDVMAKLSGMSSLLEDELGSSLDRLVLSFDQDRYEFVYSAYKMLGKREEATEKLIAAFHSSLEAASQALLVDKLGGAPAPKGPESANGRLEPKQDVYAQLCLKLESDELVVALRELGFALSNALHSFHSILRFHVEDEQQNGGQNSTNGSSPSTSSASAPGVDEPSASSRLREARRVVFATALTRMLTLLGSREFVALKFDHILEIVDMIKRFRAIGQTYFGHSCSELTSCIERQTSAYFIKYHRERLDELVMFIENESFTLCPVPFQFTIFDLQDFEFLKQSREERTPEEEGFSNGSELLMPSDWVNPFSVAQIKSRHHSKYSTRGDGKGRSTSTNSEPEDMLETSAEDPLEPACNDPTVAPPNLCNTALNLLRYFGRYIRMTALLPTICDRSAPAVADLFELFFAAICGLMGADGSDVVERPPRLVAALDDIHRRMGAGKTSSPFKAALFRSNDQASLPSLCPGVQLGYVDTLYGAAERIIAIESLEFTARQLDLMRPVVESLYPEPNIDALAQRMDNFYCQILPSVSDARMLIVDAVASRALRLPSIVEKVAGTKWDIQDLRSQHSAYVDFIIQDFEAFRLRLGVVGERGVHVSDATAKLFWRRAIYYTFKALVQGYGEGGKCSTEGRALMQLDFQNILIRLEAMTGMRPVPHVAYVDDYIKAYYLPESSLEQWIASHKEYSSKQLTSLLAVTVHVSKKTRTRILGALSS